MNPFTHELNNLTLLFLIPCQFKKRLLLKSLEPLVARVRVKPLILLGLVWLLDLVTDLKSPITDLMIKLGYQSTDHVVTHFVKAFDSEALKDQFLADWWPEIVKLDSKLQIVFVAHLSNSNSFRAFFRRFCPFTGEISLEIELLNFK